MGVTLRQLAVGWRYDDGISSSTKKFRGGLEQSELARVLQGVWHLNVSFALLLRAGTAGKKNEGYRRRL